MPTSYTVWTYTAPDADPVCTGHYTTPEQAMTATSWPDPGQWQQSGPGWTLDDLILDSLGVGLSPVVISRCCPPPRIATAADLNRITNAFLDADLDVDSGNPVIVLREQRGITWTVSLGAPEDSGGVWMREDGGGCEWNILCVAQEWIDSRGRGPWTIVAVPPGVDL